MRDRRRLGRFVAASAAALLVGLVVAPAAWAQTDELSPPNGEVSPPEGLEPAEDQGPWQGSAFDAPFDDGEDTPTLHRDTFAVAGTFRYRKQGPSEHIASATLRVIDDPDDDFTPPDACTLPDPRTFEGEGPEPELTAELTFSVDDLTVACNGRYLLEAEAQLDDPDAPTYTMARSFVLAALPAAVTGLTVDVDAGARRATVAFTPLPEEQHAIDALGYVVERAGPADDDGALGTYGDVATIGLDDDPVVVDDLAAAAPGRYSYRVRAVRDGADGPVRSSVIDTETAAIVLEGPPRTTTSSTPRATAGTSRRGGGRLTVPSRRRSSGRPTTVTTIDTGFEETLDYGPTSAPATSDPSEELAGDEPVAGQSIVRDEAESVDLLVPAAGALVMLGWAGHIVYLNRLARQL